MAKSTTRFPKVNNQKKGLRLPVWAVFVIGGLVLVFSLWAALSSSTPTRKIQPTQKSALDSVTDNELSALQTAAPMGRNDIGCIVVKSIALYPQPNGNATWKENRPCAEVSIFIPTEIENNELRLAVLRKELATVRVLDWVYKNGIENLNDKEVSGPYNILVDGLGVAILSEADQELLLGESPYPYVWDSKSDPEDVLLTWIDVLSKRGLIHSGGVGPYHQYFQTRANHQ